MWVLWFWKVGGPSRAMDKSLAGADKWRIISRKKWNYKHIVAIAGAVMLLLFAAHNVTSNEEAMSAKETLDFCYGIRLALNAVMQGIGGMMQSVMPGHSLHWPWLLPP